MRLNLEGTAEVSIMFLQPRTVHIDRLTPVPTTSITQLTSKLARWTLKNLPPRTTKEGALKSENYENDSLIKFQFSSQANRDPDPGINHDPELPHMLLDSSPDKPGYMITSEEKALIDSEGLSRHTPSPSRFESSQNSNSIDDDLQDVEFMFDESNPNLIPLGGSIEDNIEKCLSDFLEEEYHPKIQRTRTGPLSSLRPRNKRKGRVPSRYHEENLFLQNQRSLRRLSPYGQRDKFPKLTLEQPVAEENTSLVSDMDDCLMELDTFLNTLDIPNSTSLNTPIFEKDNPLLSWKTSEN